MLLLIKSELKIPSEVEAFWSGIKFLFSVKVSAAFDALVFGEVRSFFVK